MSDGDLGDPTIDPLPVGGSAGAAKGKQRHMASDYLPKNDSELVTWLANFVTVLNGNLAAVGLVAADVTPLTGAQTGFGAAVTDQIAKQAAAKAAVETKFTKKDQLEVVIRPLVRRINNHPGMTNTLRGQLGINAPTGTRTQRGVGPEIPGMILNLEPGRVVIHFGTDAGNELTNHKPDWAKGCNIYRRIGATGDFALIAFDTASPYVDIHGLTTASNVSYRAAYRGTKEADIGASCPEQTVATGP